MRFHASLVVAVCLAGCATRPPITIETPQSIRPRAGGAMQQLQREWQDEHGAIPHDAFARIHEEMKWLRASSDVSASVAGIDRNSWTWLGPGNIGGRIAALHISGTTMFAASVGGGLWKSTDLGQTWAPVDDFLSVLATTTLATDPVNGNVMYAGTGEGFGNGGALRGMGVFKSTDGGASWSHLSSTNTSDWYAVNWLTISPNGSVILAATTGLAGASGGIWRSTDGGSSWTRVAEGANIGHVEFHPADASKAIASTRTGQALYSSDGGATWSASDSISSEKRVQVAYARANPSIVYASVDDGGGELWKSTDGGVTYTTVHSGTKFLGDQGWIHNAIWIDPTNPNTLVLGGLDLWRSTDGGTTLTKISQWQKSPESAHGDQKVIVASPGFNGTTDTTVYVGNDGGIYRTQDVYTVEPLGGWQPLNNNLGVTQFYGIASNPATGMIVGGTQDNGTIRYSGDAQKWTPMYGGDGGYVAADPTDPNTFYGEYVYLTIHRSEDGGNWKADDIYGQYYSWDGEKWVKLSRDNPITEAKSGTANFIAPFLLDPNNPNRMLAGARSLWVSDNVKKSNKDGGPDWRALKAPAGESSSNNISAISVAPGKSEIIMTGHGNGAVYRTNSGLAVTPDWTRVGEGTLPSRTVLSLAIDPRDANVAYATFGGFTANNVWKTTDGGATWISISQGLPSAPARSLVIHPQNSSWIYLGTEVGIFASEDAGGSWKLPHDGPANVAVRQLIWMNNDLVAGTFGRGVYKATVGSVSASSVGCYTLELTTTGPGGVLADVAPNCNHQRGYRGGTEVTLRARGGLKEWTGDASGNSQSIKVVMNQNRRIGAVFSHDVCHALNIEVFPVNSGRVIADPPPNCGTQYQAGTLVVLEAEPLGGFAFGGWDGDAAGSEPIETMEMESDHTVTAIFAVPASNDEPATAFDLTPHISGGAIYSVLEDTSNASNSANDPYMCEGGKSGKTVWFRFVPPRDGVLDLDTDGSNYDTTLSVWEVENDGDLQSEGCDDDSDNESKADDGGTVDYEDGVSEEQLSYMSVYVFKGLTYYIEVGDATEPEQLPQEAEVRGGDPGDVPEGGLLVLHSLFSSGAKKRAVRH